MQKERVRADREKEYLRRSHEENLKRVRDDLTRMIPKSDEGVFYPQGKLDQPVVIVAENPGLHDRFAYGVMHRADDYRFYNDHVRTHRLVAVQHALRLPDGTTVVWWGWELK